MDLGRAARSTRTKNAKYRDFSDSDCESVQSEYEKGEGITGGADSSDSDTNSEENTIIQVVNERNNTNISYIHVSGPTLSDTLFVKAFKKMNGLSDFYFKYWVL